MFQKESFLSFRYRFSGVYLVDRGEMYFIANDKFEIWFIVNYQRDFFGLDCIPDMISNATTANLVREITIERLKKQIELLETEQANLEAIQGYLFINVIDSIGTIQTNHTCSLKGFFKINPISQKDEDDTAHHIESNSMLYSPECGFVLQSNASKGLSNQLQTVYGKSFALILSITTLIQILISIKYIETHSTPSVHFITTFKLIKGIRTYFSIHFHRSNPN